MADYAPSWRWDENGDTVEGQVLELRDVETRFGPSRVVAMAVDGLGVFDVWASSKPLQRWLNQEQIKPGHRIRIKRAGKELIFDNRTGEPRMKEDGSGQMERWVWETELLDGGVNDLPVEDWRQEVPDDADIPF